MNAMEFDGERFRDLDHDGVLSPYEDWRLTPEERARDLVRRLSHEEKVGLTLHGTLTATGGPMGIIGIGPEYDLDVAKDLILERCVNSMISRIGLAPAEIARQNNEVQKIAAMSRFGIPATISTDPRHHQSAITGAGVERQGYTSWPGPLGLAASREPDLVRQFGDVVRQEYRATGLHMALSPQADLATSPCWPRIDGTFGEDPKWVRRFAGAYVEGVQGGTEGLTKDSVAAVVKHWVGYGAAPSGYDGHNYYGRFSSIQGDALSSHVSAFLDAFAHHVAGVMPTYNILQDLVINGEVIEQVGAGYSHELLEGLLRTTHQFDGVILSDWSIAKDVNDACRTGKPEQMPWDISMAWGVEDLSRAERFAKGINAGLDQFGGEDDPVPLLTAIDTGLIDETRLDASAYRVLLQKFQLGLFEQPQVDPDAASEIVGNEKFLEQAVNANHRSFVFLKTPEQPLLQKTMCVYLHGIDTDSLAEFAIEATANPAEADLAIIKLSAPYENLHPGFFFGSRQHEGDLDFKTESEALAVLKEISALLPTIAVIEMDRPVVLTHVKDLSTVLVASFGGSDTALLALLLETVGASGHLPFSLPKSMNAVRAQSPDKPMDDPDPLFVIGFGLVQ